MFTGLVTHIGTISKIVVSDNIDTLLQINVKWPDDINLGSSVCCNGVCLTVINKNKKFFEVEYSKETSQKTNLKDLKIHDKINLEKSLKVGQEIGGHSVTGHIDGIATVIEINRVKGSYELFFDVENEIISFLAEKGSVTLNGVSLTVNKIFNNSFTVNIINHTWNNTNLSLISLGSTLNLEIDIISRYVNRHLMHYINKK